MASKDAKDDVTISSVEKKRRRASKPEKPAPDSPNSDTRSRASLESKPGNKALFYYEENEVSQRDPNEDLELHKAACDELRRVMQRISEIKAAGKDASGELEELRVHGTLQFVTLKKLNRLGHFRSKKQRETTNEAKQKIDQHHLRLQNLLYEVVHLQKEITKCLQFKSKDEEIPLVDVSEFYAEAPPEISKPEQTTKDPHQQMLARLDWELEQRQRLSEKLKEAQSHKDEVVKEISVKHEYLSTLQPKLNTILQSTKPVQEHLGMPFDEIREQHRTAAFLPHPLYVLYMQVSAYADACDKYISVSIQGDVEAAKAAQESAPDVDDDSDSDQEDQEKPNEKRRRRTTEGDRLTKKRNRLLRKHALSVCVVIKCRDKSVLTLTFYYLVAMEITTVTVKLVPSTGVICSSISGGDLLSADTLLSCLYPEDYGTDTPNAANNYLLEKMGFADFHTYVSEVGRPFLWSQWLCGLQFLRSADQPQRAQTSVSASHMEDTMKRLRRRVHARLSLQKQLASLERCSLAVSAEYQPLFPAKITSRLTQWKRSTYEDFQQCTYTQSLLTSGLVTPADMFFYGSMERGSATVSLHVAINADYPATAPVMALALKWKTERTALNDENIRDMEAEVSVYYEELVNDKSRDQLLTNQLQRLLLCIDVYLETETMEGSTEFARDKICPRLGRGPTRAKPYRYNTQLGFFMQR